jgi:pimeloyl-ACP methyl ester carboxylesterase
MMDPGYWRHMTGATTLVAGRLGGLSVWTGGEGPLVVLVHGLGGSARNWVEVVPGLLPRRRVIAVDQPGHGGSPAPPPGARLDDFVDAVAGVIEASAGGPALLAGHSFGGQVAARLAVRRPELVRGVLLCAPSGLSTTRRVARAVVAATGIVRPSKLVAALAPRLGASVPFRRVALAGLVADAAALSEQALRGLLVDARRHADIRPAGRAMTHDDAAAWVRPLEVPALVLHGACDAQVPATDGVAWARLLDAPVRLVAGCGHLVVVERPGAALDCLAALDRS